MRYIDLSNIELPQDLQNKITDLNNELRAFVNHTDRINYIDKNQVWRDLFIQLSRLGFNKCWYSEAKDTMSDRDIDHFRPKKEAKNLPNIPRKDEEGYWFLAFDIDNFRFSSMYSNQRRSDKFDKTKKTGGKGAFFPLFENSSVAKSKNFCADEDIMLLDPCDRDDVNLLTFDNRGSAILNLKVSSKEKDKERVETSVHFYNLDHTSLVDLRVQVWGKCQRFIDEIRAINIEDNLGISSKARIKFLNNEIRKMMDKEQELSAVAIACCEQNGLSVLAEVR